MKKHISLALLCPISVMAGIVFPLASCNKGVPAETITLTCYSTDGVELIGSKTVKVEKNLIWKDACKQLPTPKFTKSNMLDFGWCKQNSTGKWEVINDGFVLDANIDVSYVAYSQDEHPSTTVNLNFSPEAQVTTLNFIKGSSFGVFRSLYQIPAQPVHKGYDFKGFFLMDGETEKQEINDSYVFPLETTNIKIKWEKKAFTATIVAGGGGSVDKNSISFKYKDTWSSVKSNVIATPNDGYKFDKWVYSDTKQEIADDAVLTDSFSATALFKIIVKRTITFAKSDGVEWTDPTKANPLIVVDGAKWSDIKKNVPAVTVNETQYTPIGWVAWDNQGNYNLVTDDYVVSNDITAKYVAIPNSSYQTQVTITFGPDSTKHKATLTYIQNGTFGGLRQIYGIPESPSYEGYTFDGWFVGATKIGDTYTFNDSACAIVGKFTLITYKVDFIVDSFYGTIDKSTLQIGHGTAWSDVLKQVTVTPKHGFTLSKWVDSKNNEISPTHQIKSAFTAKAVFTNKPVIEPVANSTKAYVEDSHKLNNVQYSQLRDGSWPGDGWKTPEFNNSEMKFWTARRSLKLRMITQTYKMTYSIEPHQKRTVEIWADGKWACKSNGYIVATLIQSTIQAFKLSGPTDHPDYYTNQARPGDKSPTDPRCKFIKTYRYNQLDWAEWEESEDISDMLMAFSDTNNTNEAIMVTHYFSISQIVEGQSGSNGNHEAGMNIKFSTTDIIS